MADWTALPLDILVLIAQRLTFIEDFVSFRAICKDCQYVTGMWEKKPSLPPRYPRLMLAENTDTKDRDVSIRGFLNLLTSTISGIELTETIGKRCLGAYYGWLFTLGSDLQINLLHPFSRQKICLPPMLTFPDQYQYHEECPPQKVFRRFVQKVVMSAIPLKRNDLNDECVMVAIYGEFSVLAFARLGDTVWTNIQVPSCWYEDVVHYKGKFYAVNCRGVVVVCDIDDNNGPKATTVAPPPSRTHDQIQKYLVESSEDLLLVSRDRGGWLYEDVSEEENARSYTIGFSILRLDESRDESNNYTYKLTEVTNLGDRALFLGKNASTSIASSDCIKANCIYFTDDNIDEFGPDDGGSGRDTGIFNIEDGTVQFDYAGESRGMITPPLWYI